MSQDTEILQQVGRILHPYLNNKLEDLNLVDYDPETKTFHIIHPSFCCPAQQEIEQQCSEILRGSEYRWESRVEQCSNTPPFGETPLKNVKNIIAVGSGKGGVGKSTVTSNLAATLALSGAQVGILDADVYGPSIPKLFGCSDHILKVENKKIQPANAHGVSIMSMAFLMKPGESVIWRGPMLHGVMQQFMKDVLWPDLDFLLIDLPPGTGDVALSICQSVSLGGSIIVTTPEDLAVSIAVKAGNMFQKLQVPISGIIENMSSYLCPHCHHEDNIFGQDGGKQAAAQLETSLLGGLPLNSHIRIASDLGKPIVLNTEATAIRKAYQEVTQGLVKSLVVQALQPAHSAL